MKPKYIQYENEFKKKKNDYIKYLRDCLKDIRDGKETKTLKEWNKNNQPYIDPDGTQGNKDSLFYNNLKSFINKKEGKVICEFQTNTAPQGIKVNVIDVFGKKLTLRSDQLGFSAPHYSNLKKDKAGWSAKYPYAKYLLKSDNCKYIAKIIWNCRTIGGSFLWPVVKNGKYYYSIYNQKRGVGSYIDDRADLTLLEIKKFYQIYEKVQDPNKIREIMKEYCILLKNNDYINIYYWLSYFKTFKKYVDFFCFNSFVDKNYNVLSLVNNKPIYDVHKEKRIYEMNHNEIKKILRNINKRIITRTIDMERIINGETNK